MLWTYPACFLLLSASNTDPVLALRDRLAAANPTADLTVEFRLAHTQTNEGEAANRGAVHGLVHLSDGVLRVEWPRSVVDAMQAERNDPDPESPAPIARAARQLTPAQLADWTEAQRALLRYLDIATLKSTAADSRDGHAVTRLELQLQPRLDKRTARYIKELDASLLLWLDAEGWPVATERRLRTKGRAMMVISFEASEVETLTYQRIGDRLLVSHYQLENDSRGGGEQGKVAIEATLKPIQPSAATATVTSP